MATRALGKYFQDQHGAVVHWQLEVPLQIALLRRTQGLVEQNLCRAMLERQLLDLVGLAAADEQRRIRRPAFARHVVYRRHAGRPG